MLTAEQRAIRATGVGASETAALLGLSPYKAAIDVWLVKRGLVQEEETDRADVGSALESGVMGLLCSRTGLKIQQPYETVRHPRFEHVLASPDGLVEGGDGGAEIKIVGARMLHHWEGDTVPDYVLVQVAQNLAVTERSWWIVGALLGGTDFRTYRIERDQAFEETIIDAVESFWRDHVMTGDPPPVTDPEERKRYLRARYPGSARTKCREDSTTKTARLVAKLERAKASKAKAERAELDASTRLLSLLGDEYGIEGPWGKFIAPKIAGRVDWRAVAEEMGGGVVPTDLIEQHRAEATRQARFYRPKET